MDSIYNNIKQMLIPYGNLPEENLKRVFKHFQINKYTKDDFFSKAGDTRQIVGIQLSGIFRSYIITEKGTEKTTDFCRSGDILTTYETEKPSTKWIQSLNDSTIATIDNSLFEKLIEKDITWQLIIRIMTKSCLTLKLKREMELLSLDGLQKYDLFLKSFNDIAPEIPQYQIASYLGISPVSLSRIRGSR